MPALIYLSMLLLAGYAITLPMPPRSRIERLGFAAILGPAFVGLCLIYLSMLGQKPTGELARLLACGFFLPLIYIFPRRFRLQSPLKTPTSPFTGMQSVYLSLCFLAIAYGICIVAKDTWRQTPLEFDAFAIWQLKAKLLASQPLMPRPDYFHNIALSFSHLRYPILVPMISAGVHALSGDINDNLGQTPYLLMYIGMGSVIFGYLQEATNSMIAAGATAYLMLVPVQLRYAAAGTAELALEAFFAASLVALLRWQESGRWTDLMFSAFAAAAMAWTKNEGLAMAAVNGIVLLILMPRPRQSPPRAPIPPVPPAEATSVASLPPSRAAQQLQSLHPPVPSRSATSVAALPSPHPNARTRGAVLTRLTPGAFFAAIVLALFAPWWLYARSLLRTDEDYAARLTFSSIAAHADRLTQILQSIASELFRWNDFNVFWLMPLALALLNPRRLASRPVLTVWTILLAGILIYIPPLMVTPNDLSQLLPHVLDRLLMHTLPAATILIGLQWPTTRHSSYTHSNNIFPEQRS